MHEQKTLAENLDVYFKEKRPLTKGDESFLLRDNEELYKLRKRENKNYRPEKPLIISERSGLL